MWSFSSDCLNWCVLLFMSFSCTHQMFVGRKVSFSLSTFSPFYWFYWLYWFLTAVLFPRVVKKLTQLDSHLTVYIQWILWAGFPAFFAESCKILREEMGNWLSLQLTVIINQYIINKSLNQINQKENLQYHSVEILCYKSLTWEKVHKSK